MKSGKGGDGAISYHRLGNYKKKPDGGHGGKGGDVIIKACNQVHSLSFPKFHYNAADGINGGEQGRNGRKAKHLILRVPPGTLVKARKKVKTMTEGALLSDPKESVVSDISDISAFRDLSFLDGFANAEEFSNISDYNQVEQVKYEVQVLADLKEDGDSITVCTGGNGGRGNSDFLRGSYKAINTAKAERRKKGKEGTFKSVELTLKTIADAGLVGFPNAGKSTLLGALSKSKPEVAPYPFTTLHPYVGVLEFTDTERLTVADIPGLVEGASENKGLGHDFLRHVERTHVLVYVIDVSGSNTEDIAHDFAALVNELEMYKTGITSRPSLVVLNKVDSYDKKVLQVNDMIQKMKAFEDTTENMEEQILASNHDPEISVATIGHRDHGKSTLASAINIISDLYASKDVNLNQKSGTEDHILDNSSDPGVAVLVVSVTDGPMHGTHADLLKAQESGFKSVVVFLNKIDEVEDEEIVELAETEIREILHVYGFNGDDARIIRGSALAAVEGRDDDIGKYAILDLLESVNSHFPPGEQQLKKRFQYPKENAFSPSETTSDQDCSNNAKMVYVNQNTDYPSLSVEQEVRNILDLFSENHKNSTVKSKGKKDDTELQKANGLQIDNIYSDDYIQNMATTLVGLNKDVDEVATLPLDPLDMWQQTLKTLPQETQKALPTPYAVIPVSAMNQVGMRDVAHSLRKLMMKHEKPMGAGLNR